MKNFSFVYLILIFSCIQRKHNTKTCHRLKSLVLFNLLYQNNAQQYRNGCEFKFEVISPPPFDVPPGPQQDFDFYQSDIPVVVFTALDIDNNLNLYLTVCRDRTCQEQEQTLLKLDLNPLNNVNPRIKVFDDLPYIVYTFFNATNVYNLNIITCDNIFCTNITNEVTLDFNLIEPYQTSLNLALGIPMITYIDPNTGFLSHILCDDINCFSFNKEGNLDTSSNLIGVGDGTTFSTFPRIAYTFRDSAVISGVKVLICLDTDCVPNIIVVLDDTSYDSFYDDRLANILNIDIYLAKPIISLFRSGSGVADVGLYLYPCLDINCDSLYDLFILSNSEIVSFSMKIKESDNSPIFSFNQPPFIIYECLNINCTNTQTLPLNSENPLEDAIQNVILQLTPGPEDPVILYESMSNSLNITICRNITDSPTIAPTSPTFNPTVEPTFSPSQGPTLPTNSPTHAPTQAPTFSPTSTPTFSPTISPTPRPTNTPSNSPSPVPTIPSKSPTPHPSISPTFPTPPPTPFPSYSPTLPTKSPTNKPTKKRRRKSRSSSSSDDRNFTSSSSSEDDLSTGEIVAISTSVSIPLLIILILLVLLCIYLLYRVLKLRRLKRFYVPIFKNETRY